jgi:hypothetical protein
MENYVNTICNVFKSLKLSQGVFSRHDEMLHACRCQLDPFIYGALKNLYGANLKNHWETSSIPLISNKAISIVERRCHPNLEFCLHNAAYFARGYAIHIFCSSANIDFVRGICGNQLPNIHIHEVFEHIGTPEQGKHEYNELLKSAFFWDFITEEHVITIETDSYFLDFIPESIYNYDYVACRWPWAPEELGGGGLSYRKTVFMKRMIESNIVDLTKVKLQDGFAAEGMKLLNAKVPSIEESYEYFVEAHASRIACGVHQWWTFMWKLKDEDLQLITREYLTLNISPSV